MFVCIAILHYLRLSNQSDLSKSQTIISELRCWRWYESIRSWDDVTFDKSLWRLEFYVMMNFSPYWILLFRQHVWACHRLYISDELLFILGHKYLAVQIKEAIISSQKFMNYRLITHIVNYSLFSSIKVNNGFYWYLPTFALHIHSTIGANIRKILILSWSYSHSFLRV